MRDKDDKEERIGGYESQIEFVWGIILRINRETNPFMLDEWCRKYPDEPLVLSAIARNRHARRKLLGQLARNRNCEIRRSVAMNPRCSRKRLRRLARDRDVNVRCEVALNISAPKKALKRLAKDTKSIVRSAYKMRREN